MENDRKEKIFKYLVMAYFIISPIFDLIFLYNRVTTLIRVSILLVFTGVTLIIYKDSRKNFKYLMAFYLSMLGYFILSYFHSTGFNSALPYLKYNIFDEIAVILKLCMPFTILFILKYQNIEKKEFFRIINLWIIMIAGSIVIMNFVGYSLSSYTNEITSHNIFSWGSGLTVDQTATKGFFAYANQVAIDLLMLLILAFYELIDDKDRKTFKAVSLLVIIALAMVMLGTRLSTYGGVLVLAAITIGYFGYSIIRKMRILRSSIASIIIIIAWICIMPISPCNDRVAQINSAKDGIVFEKSDQARESFETDEEKLGEVDLNLAFIENNINRAAIGEQFYKDYYPYDYDMDFWSRVVEYQKDNYIDYRQMELMIVKRLWEIDNRKSDYLVGISNSIVQDVTNIERDFVLHFYSFGIIGSLLCLSFYIYMIVVCVKAVLKDFNLWNIAVLGILALFILGSYMTGNSLNFLATIVPCAFIVSFGRKLKDC